MAANERQNIALWGFGRYGKRLYRAIEENWAAEYHVVAVFDRAFLAEENAEVKVLRTRGLVACEPERIGQLYIDGAFEGVLIAVGNATYRFQMARQLKDMGVPEVTLGTIDDFKTAEAFEGIEQLAYGREYGFNVHRYRDIAAFADLLDSPRPALYLFDANSGSMVRDIWFENSLKYEPRSLNYPRPPKPTSKRAIQLTGEYCIVVRPWPKNYWHFTFQQLDQMALMEKEGFTGFYVTSKSIFAESLIALAGIDASRVLWLEDLDADALYCFERAIALQRDAYNFELSAPLLLEIADRILSNVLKGKPERDGYPKRLYVKRTGTRKLLDVDRLLAKYGFETITPDELSVEEQIRYFNAADVVLCPHGANSTNSLYMRPGTVFVETFSVGWLNSCCHETLFARGVHYLPVVNLPVNRNIELDQVSDYRIRPSLLESAIQSALILAERENK